MRLIQITDCHLHADPQARSRRGVPLAQLHAVMEKAAELRPDWLLVSGDVSQDLSLASYQHAVRAFDALDCPWHWLPGNHDDARCMQALHPLAWDAPLGDWHLLLLDSQLEGQAKGALKTSQLEALRRDLQGDARPTLLAVHHPPLAVGAQWLDAIGLENCDAFWRALEEQDQVRAVLCGHIHQAFTGERNGVTVYGCPSTSDQFLPGARDFAVDETARPGLRIIDLDGDTFTTRVERVNC